MVKATGKKLWRRTVEVLFRQLICHKWGGNFLWVSVDHIPGSLNDEAKYDNEGDRPDWHNIVTDDMKYSSTALRRFIDQGAKMMEALSCVYDEDTLARTLLGTEVLTRSAQKARSANKATPLSVGAVNDIVIKTAGGGGDDGDDDDGDDDDEEEEGDVNSASANMLSRHSGGNSGVGGGAPADGSAASRTSNADADAVQPDAPPVRDGVVGKVETLTADLKALRISKSKKSFSKKEKKKIGHLHYETAQILREGGDEIAANPKDGGRPMYFVRVAKSLGGKSKSTVSRGAAAATSFLQKQSVGSDATVSAAVEKKVAAGMDNVMVTFDSKLRQLIVPDEGDQLAISEIVGSDNKVLQLNRLLAKTTGFLMVKPGFSLAKATDSDLPSFVVSREKLMVEGNQKLRRTFRVKSISEVICSQNSTKSLMRSPSEQPRMLLFCFKKLTLISILRHHLENHFHPRQLSLAD